ncbi:DNA recombination protein RmuC [Sphingomicrobium marinum]|uniref:DNA recombination protein RmuC n=1 Tax=Sphingomicrobium marinum TaxID=1227950 RepID=UPI002240DC5E|nr:DNA recombination protein RmuC [Sphingomicrobium marinum]
MNILVGLIIGAVIGGVIGFLIAKLQSGKSEAQVENLRMQLDSVREERDEARTRIDAAQDELAALKAEKATFDQRLKDFHEQKDAQLNQFREAADRLLDKAQKDFLEKAGARFSEADQKSEAQLKGLVDPIQKLLAEQKAKIDAVEKDRVSAYSGLKAVVDEVKRGQGQVRDETRNLVNALRSSPKARGRWGEKTLENVLQQAGLSEHIDYLTEVSVDGEDGRLRPDAVVNLPGGRKLVIDAKCSLNAYLDATDEVDDDARDRYLSQHLASMKNHAQQLGSKSYWAQFDDAADYVVMFVPGEHFLTAALEKDSGLWDWAFEKKVLLATPTNLVAIARTVASVWNQERLKENAKDIEALGKELHSRIATMADHVLKMGTHLSRANDSYNKMVGSMESQVFTQARRFEELGSGSAKEIAEPGVVEASPRPLTKLSPPPKGANDGEDAA